MMVATIAPLSRRRSRSNSRLLRIPGGAMPRPFSPFDDVDLASKSYEIQLAMARLVERGPRAQYAVAQRSLLVSKCTPGAKDADHTVMPVAALAGCRVRGDGQMISAVMQRARG